MQPFITSSHLRKNQSANSSHAPIPQGYSSLFDYETDKKNTANIIFQKMLQAEIDEVKDMFNLWNKDHRRNLTQDINSTSHLNCSQIGRIYKFCEGSHT